MLEILSVTGATRVTRRLKFSCVSLYNDNKILLNLENCKLVSARHLNLTYKWGRGQSLNWGGGGVHIHVYDFIRSSFTAVFKITRPFTKIVFIKCRFYVIFTAKNSRRKQRF